MSSRWYGPDFEYRPRHHHPTSWGKVAWLIGFPLASWMLVLAIIYWQFE